MRESKAKAKGAVGGDEVADKEGVVPDGGDVFRPGFAGMDVEAVGEVGSGGKGGRGQGSGFRV